jgi:hypothetical protein
MVGTDSTPSLTRSGGNVGDTVESVPTASSLLPSPHLRESPSEFSNADVYRYEREVEGLRSGGSAERRKHFPLLSQRRSAEGRYVQASNPAEQCSALHEKFDDGSNGRIIVGLGGGRRMVQSPRSKVPRCWRTASKSKWLDADRSSLTIESDVAEVKG